MKAWQSAQERCVHRSACCHVHATHLLHSAAQGCRRRSEVVIQPKEKAANDLSMHRLLFAVSGLGL